MEMPLVSVLISAYNEEEYINKSINSVFNQTYGNYELIIVDDGSTDNTLKVLREHKKKHKNFKIIIQKNQGITKALNHGLKHCKGEYIARLDASDEMVPDRLIKQVAWLEANKDHALLGSFREEHWYDTGKSRRTVLQTLNSELQLAMVKGSSIPHATILVRGDIIREYKYDESFKTSQDYDLWVRIAKDYNVANMPQFLIRAGNRTRSISANKKKLHTLITQLRIRWKAYRYLDCPKWYIIFMLKPFAEMIIPRKLIQFKIDSKSKHLNR